ncbi:MAG: mechanosensitive ion channel family protein [Candidatus Bathyarchaeota archaeon]|nr:mechanosensitive ion channel family protein [Candidatus Bathyarchaeota archaeon]
MTAVGLADILQGFGIGQLESELVAAFVVFLVALTIGWVIYLVFRRYLGRWAKGTKTQIDDEILRNIKAPIVFLAILFGMYYALETITYLAPYSEIITRIFSVTQIFLSAFIIIRVLNVLFSWFAARAKQEKRVSEHLLFVLKQIIRAIVYMAAFLAILAANKIDLSGLAVGVGVSGIAIALAVQNILGDAFSAFLIYFDRPFEVGDFIVVDGYSGTVRKIGIRSTRLQLLQGEELVISNKELTESSIRNFKKLRKRRVVFTVGVAADTPVVKLKKIPKMIENIISNIKLTEFDRVHCAELGDFSYKFEIVFYTKTSDYAKYMDIRQEINFGIIEAFEKEGIVMPFPTQSISLMKNDDESLRK